MEIYRTQNRPVIRWIFLILFASIFAGDLVLVKLDGIGFLDSMVSDFCPLLHDEMLTMIAKGITFMANTTTLLALCILLILLPTRGTIGFPVGIATGIAALCHFGLKELIARPRPDAGQWLVNVTGYSFPSGHSNAALVFYLFLMLLLRRYLLLNKNTGASAFVCIVFPLLVVAIGASRLYLGVHYASDVIGGWSLGMCLLVILFTLYEIFWPHTLQFTEGDTSWGMLRKRRPWRHPQTQTKDTDMIQFPKNRTPWRRPNTTAKRREQEEQKRRDQEEKERVKRERRGIPEEDIASDDGSLPDSAKQEEA
ncbi:MAG: phosphatase PAP2 family protein [Clostridiales Family XIII bacterium]|jgi:undecaprenyl-diphosphatase|nr:phosphatase PAP2 family protein [Clostridiales Family XIII bacterium]